MSCLECEKETKNLKFCSRSCGAIHRNKHNPPKKLQDRKCKHCTNMIGRKSSRDNRIICGKCVPSNTVDWSNITYSQITGKRKYQKNSQIRNQARAIYLKSDNPKKCIVCGYDKHYQVCHIKAISQYKDDAKVSEINALKNLIALCPNHHWELDYGKCLDISQYVINSNSLEHVAPVYDRNDLTLSEDERMKKEIERKQNKNPKCIDCSCVIARGSTRCNSCAHKKSFKFEVTKEGLEELIEKMSFVKVGKKFGVSDNAIRKRCVRLGIDYKNLK